MTGQVTLEHLSAQFKIYLLILHTIVLGWIVHILITVFSNKFGSSKYVANIAKDASSVRVVHVGDKRVTVESCHWLNSILLWLYMNASSTPDLLKIWLTMLNEKLKTDKNSVQFRINGIVPGSLPPILTNVYCSNGHSSVQCIAMHIESSELGFYISLLENNNANDKPTADVEVSITELSGEIIFQVTAQPDSRYDLTVKFIGDPKLKISSSETLEESDRSTVEEKLKEVICKTVVNIPLTEGKPGNEAIETNLAPESSSSCVDTDGKLLVKIIRASGLTGIDKADVPDAYCVLGSKGTTEKKKTKTIKGTKDPVWNESHVIDMSEKTKEIVFDIFNEQKTSEEEGFLGQVIVPLGMIGKDQSCRLILPVLPTSSKNSYVGGQIHLEFTYDKDGKAFETSTEAASSKPNVTSEQKKESDLPKAKVEEVRPSSPQRLVFSMATLDIIDDDDDKLEFLPLLDHGIGREDIVEAEHKISERSKHGGYETDPVLIEENKKHQEMFQELIELDEQTALQDGSKIQQNQVKNEPAKTSQQRSPPQQSPTTTSPVQVSVTLPSPDEPQKVGTGEKPEEAKPSTDATEGAPSKQDKMKEPLTLDESLMEDLTPNTKRKVFRKAFSMRIRRDQEPPSERIETNVQQSRSSGVEKRHSFSGGEKVQPITKSGSDVSLNSLYDSAKSVLVVETRDRGKIKYYQIPSLMARRGTFDHKGCKLHICNDHLFVATHFTGTLPSCAVCSLPLTGYFGKQGYECRDCHMITHKRCHYETTDVCTQSTLSSLKIIVLEDHLV